MDINKIIGIVRDLKEDAPANSVAGGGIAGLPPDQPPVDLRRGKRRNWNPFFKDLAKMQRRKQPRI